MNAPAHLSRIKGGEHLAAAYEAIRKQGIRVAREHHHAVLKLCRSLHNVHLFGSYIHPAQDVSEAIEDANEKVRHWRRMRTWRQQRRRVEMLAAKERIVVLRYFRRYSAIIWMEAAA